MFLLQRTRLILFTQIAAVGLALVACNEQGAQQKATADAKPEVSAVTLHPQSVTITAEVRAGQQRR